jgi:hypothetical protein
MDALSAGPRYTGYEATMTAASRHLRATDLISYEEGLAAAPLPSEPPSYHKVVNDWPNSYPEMRDKDGTPWPPAPVYPHEQELEDRQQRKAGLQQEAPPTYAQAAAGMSKAFERRIDRYERNLHTGLAKEFLLPFPSEEDVAVAGGEYTERGREMAVLRTTRLARQAELLQLRQRELTHLPQHIRRLAERGVDPQVIDRLERACARAIETCRSFESQHQRLVLSSADSAQRDPLPEGDIPFHRWGMNQAERFLREAIELYGRMRADLEDEFATPLPRVRGLRARILLPRARRNELRYERSRRLEQRGELLADYFGRLRELGERREREGKSLRAGAWLLGEIDETLDEMAQYFVPFRIEHHHQLRRSL